MTAPLDPAAIVAEFIDRVAPYDPSPDAPPVAVVGVRTAVGTRSFPLGDHTIRALCRALATYRDPADRGRCVECGSRRLDDNLHCLDCGRLHGILGEVIAQHARRVADAADVDDQVVRGLGADAADVDDQVVRAQGADRGFAAAGQADPAGADGAARGS